MMLQHEQLLNMQLLGFKRLKIQPNESNELQLYRLCYLFIGLEQQKVLHI